MKSLFSNIKGDAFGGLTAGIVALPLALAFGVSSGLGPSAGLYGAIFIGFFAALFGGTSTQISGPTAPMTAVSMVVISGLIATYNGDVEAALPAILTIFLLAGVFQIGLGAAGLGKYIKYIPYPVISGFMTAIGLMILITQILPAIGYYPKEDSEFIATLVEPAKQNLLEKTIQEDVEEGTLTLTNFSATIDEVGSLDEKDIEEEAKALAASESSGVIGAINSMPRAIQKINYLELILSLVTILIIFGFKRITTAVPSTLVALLAVSGVAYGFGLDYRPIQEIPSGFPEINFAIFTNFSWSSISPYILTALSLSFLGAIDSLLTSVIADNMTKTKHNPNRELIGQGIGNSIAAFFGGIPGAGATIRTVVNINAGGKSKLSGMIAGILLLVVLLALGEVASQIPAAVLAGILITVGIGVMDYKGLKAIPKMPKFEVVIMLLVMVLSIFWNLVYAVGIGLVLASLIFMKKMGEVTASLSRVDSFKGLLATKPEEEEAWSDELNIDDALRKKLFIKHLHGPVFFGFTSELHEMAKQIPDTASVIIIRMDLVPYIDQTGVYALEDIIFDLTTNGKQVSIIGLQEQPDYLMRKIDIIPDLIPEDLLFDDFKSCVAAIVER
ncbi:SulP family inorganic anion transporter [Aquimarina brevivitae]|uniref:SulP family sulfate permease n=1 Tax=Aquimarina brevivitae TaxID=323412 RepID=A0A4Q7PFH3_9FLAO|nr:SulP family inorganic anion transporter [Aquimarina brevivitae]RZS99211.1 SulP family sulfate permease [Aquimarina brevivitae]